MKTIWKYKLTEYKTMLELPVGYEILCVNTQQFDEIYVWVRVDTKQEFSSNVTFYLVGTGREIPNNDLYYIGTVFLMGKNFVFHVFVE